MSAAPGHGTDPDDDVPGSASGACPRCRAADVPLLHPRPSMTVCVACWDAILDDTLAGLDADSSRARHNTPFT